MVTTKKGLLKGLRYITHIFEEKKELEMQIGFPTDVKHVAHIGSDSPSVNTPSWMNDFKPRDQGNGRAASGGECPKLNPDVSAGKNQRGVGLLPLMVQTQKPRNKTRRKSKASSPTDSPTRSRTSGSGDDAPSKPSRRNRSSNLSMDTSDASVRRRSHVSVPDTEGSYPVGGDGSVPPRKPTSRHRRLKGSNGEELSVKKSRGKDENSNVESVVTSYSSEKTRIKRFF
ncbi:PREDICTED: CRIB domain-containing protein RIC3-like isoform X2 [Tarenaya hassleriana]|uniref:CRIB domain-containing protein RIC3-like isoform X2 n=1 Tax=Tarenaya hassleriana TaxID=28532 RepID=UPI00053C5C96|nr:PREDICTED: CRIB domain-containing protein RIC3-like isoform X2 [Tarenaya hassleriana]